MALLNKPAGQPDKSDYGANLVKEGMKLFQYNSHKGY